MSRLIDVDKLIDKLKEYTRTNNCEFNGACRSIIEIVKQQPIAFDKDKVKEELENSSWWTEPTFDEDDWCNDDREDVIGLYEAIEIVERGGLDE